ncbi:MAG: ABC transporter permease [Acidobacteriia bacterium]|nr:ABC transporter permease [Terriglobia bacterium]
MPDWKGEITERLAGLKVDPVREAEICEELAQHLEDRYQELLHGGKTHEEAYQAIQAEWGQGGKLMDELRKIEHIAKHEPIAWGAQMGRNVLSAFVFDFRSAVRSLARSRWFAVGAALTFALGIGVNVAVFSAVDRVLFRSLPYDHPDQIYEMGEYEAGSDRSYGTMPASWVIESRRLSSVDDICVAGFTSSSYSMSSDPADDSAIRLTDASFNTLAVLGVRPFMGRDFTQEDVREKRACALISYSLWRGRFNGAPDIVGRRLWQSASHPVDIIGVLPAAFISASYFFDPASDGLALTSDTLDAAKFGERFYRSYVRLKSGVSLSVAQAQINAVVERLGPEESRAPKMVVRLVPLKTALFGRYASYLWLVVAAAGLVLLVACANLASLLLVRGRSREHQAAVRLALGASTFRLMQTAWIESLILSCIGTFIGLLVLAWTGKGMQALLPAVFSRFSSPAYDGRVIVLSILAASFSALFAGILPCLRLSRIDILASLQQLAGRGRTGRLRGGRSLLVVEAAVSIALVAGATMAARSLMGLTSNNLGFKPDGLYNVGVRLPQTQDSHVYYQRNLAVLDELRRIRGVQSAGAAFVSPISAGAPAGRLGAGTTKASRWQITDGFIEAMGMRLVSGRTFTSADLSQPESVGILSEMGLQLVWPDLRPAEAVGRMLESTGEVPRRIIGIVSDVRSAYASLPLPSFYVPVTPRLPGRDFAARLQNGSVLSAAELRDRIQARVAPPLSIRITYEPDLLSRSLLNQKFITMLFSAFGIVALILAAVGLYAVASFEVALRRSEMGLRMSLGATPGNVQRLVIREALGPVVIGLGVGIIGTYWASKFAQSWWYKIDSRDPVTYLLAATVLIAATALAAWLPARRASRIDPMAALRCE